MHNLQYAMRNFQYTMRSLQYAIRNFKYILRNFHYALRNFKYATVKIHYDDVDLLNDIIKTKYSSVEINRATHNLQHVDHIIHYDNLKRKTTNYITKDMNGNLTHVYSYWLADV